MNTDENTDLLAELAAEKAKVADLTAKLEASAEPVTVVRLSRMTAYGPEYTVQDTPKLRIQRGIDREGVPLYTAPQPSPTTSAAVAAALRKAAEEAVECYRNCGNENDIRSSIESIPADDSALRDICMNVANEVHKDCTGICPKPADEIGMKNIVDEVLAK